MLKCNVVAGQLNEHKWESRGNRKGHRILIASAAG
jgi:hypothetical protein